VSRRRRSPAFAIAPALAVLCLASAACSSGTTGQSATTTTIAKAPVAARAQSVIAACTTGACSGATPASRTFCEDYDSAVASTLASVKITSSAANVFETSEVNTSGAGPDYLRCEYSGRLGTARIGFDIVIEEPTSSAGALCQPHLACTHIVVGKEAVSTGIGSFAVICSNGWRFFVSTIELPTKQALPLLRDLNSSLTRLA
jgi:hypothetical protein